MVVTTAQRTARPRRARMLRRGWQVDTALQQVPSGKGPPLHSPP